MNNYSRGYSTLFVENLQYSDAAKDIREFAELCIEREIPIADLARRLGVTRATVYNWFTGRTEPRDLHKRQMRRLLARWRRV